jgi:hypothetical protein
VGGPVVGGWAWGCMRHLLMEQRRNVDMIMISPWNEFEIPWIHKGRRKDIRMYVTATTWNESI